LLTWDLFGEKDPIRDEMRYRTWLVAKTFEEAEYANPINRMVG